MKTKIFLLTTFIGLLSITSCDTVQQALGFVNCKYELGGVANPAVGGISLSNITNLSQINATSMIRLTAALAQGSLPLSATVNVKASNPGATLAQIEKLEWAIDLENKELLQGVVNQRISVPANGGTTTIPFTLQLDLLKVSQGNSLNDMLNLALNLANAGDNSSSSKVAIRVKPTVMVAGKAISSGFITINQSVSSK